MDYAALTMSGSSKNAQGLSFSARGVRRVFSIWITAVLLAALGSLTLMTTSARADYPAFNSAAVAPNIAVVRVEPDGVKVGLEIYIGNVAAFVDVLPDRWLANSKTAFPPLAQRLDRFSKEGLSIADQNGRVLPVSLVLAERRMRVDRASPLAGQKDPFSGRTIPSPPQDKRVIYVELFYAFGDSRPETLLFSEPKPGGAAKAMPTGLLAYDRDVPIAPFSFLSNRPGLIIDWDDPWFTKFDNPSLVRQQKTGVSTFIYVEPREVRHETLIRVRELAPWINLDLQPETVLSSADQKVLVSNALDLFSKRNPVTIDGQLRTASTARGEVLLLTETGLQVVEEDQTVRADAAFVGVVLSHPQHTLPDEVAVTWDMFNDRLQLVEATSIDPVGPFLSRATTKNSKIVWTNHLLTYENPSVIPVAVGDAGSLLVPWLTVLSAGVVLFAGLALIRGGNRKWFAVIAVLAGVTAGLTWNTAKVTVPNPFMRIPDTSVALSTLDTLLVNINTANLEITQDARQAQMQTLVTQASLSDVTAELERALAIRVPTGGLARITEISDLELNEVTPLENAFGFRALASWWALANAGHWGHDHQRALRYRALVEIVDDNGLWKLDGITVLEVASPNA